jgi:hypothetical protein
MTDVTKARQIVAELESKLAAASERSIALTNDRRRLAFSCATGNAKARSQLEKLNTDSALVLVENENAHIALEEARHRLASAEQAAALAERKANAERLHGQVKELAAKIEARGPGISAALASLSEEFVGLQDDLLAVCELGAQIVPQRLVALSFSDVVSHTLRSVGLDLGDTVPPDRRHSPESLTTGYASRATTWADAIILKEAA